MVWWRRSKGRKEGLEEKYSRNKSCFDPPLESPKVLLRYTSPSPSLAPVVRPRSPQTHSSVHVVHSGRHSQVESSPWGSLYVVFVDVVVVVAAVVLMWQRLLGGGSGQGVVADCRGWLRRRQTHGRGRKGVMRIEGVGGGGDVVVLGGGGVRRRPDDD